MERTARYSEGISVGIMSRLFDSAAMGEHGRLLCRSSWSVQSSEFICKVDAKSILRVLGHSCSISTLLLLAS